MGLICGFNGGFISFIMLNNYMWLFIPFILLLLFELWIIVTAFVLLEVSHRIEDYNLPQHHHLN